MRSTEDNYQALGLEDLSAADLKQRGISVAVAAIECSGAKKDGFEEQYNFWMKILRKLLSDK